MAVQVPQFAVPFRVEDGTVAVVEQGSKEEIRQCVLACVATRLGSRMEAPDYGVADQTFKRQRRNPSAEAFVRAVAAVEPRVRLLATSEVEGLIQRVQLETERNAA